MCSCGVLQPPVGVEGARTGPLLQVGVAARGEDTHDVVRPAVALTQKLLFLRRDEEDCQLSDRKPHSLSWDSTPSTSCGSCSSRTRASTEDLAEDWPAPESESTKESAEEEDSLGSEDSTEAKPETFLSACSSPTSRLSSGDHSLDSLTERRASFSSASSSAEKEAPEAQSASSQQRSGGCLAGCLPWLFGREHAVERRRKSTRLSDGRVEYDLCQLTRVGLLGFGSFGSVTLEKCRLTDKCFALKAVSKGLVEERCLHSVVKMEKMAMRRCNSPFIIRLFATFNRGQYVYFLLEAVLGGDLYASYARRFLFGSEEHARFYMACLVRALEHLHENHIIYRDIKMENVVLDAEGYGKLCDFGLSTILSPEDGGRAYTICGTPEYMAPEVAESVGYTRAADWWSLGVLLYELMVGDVPFSGEDPSLIHLSVAQGIEAAQLPAESWAEVARGLCQLDPSQRLPMQEWGVEGLERQAWFAEVNFDWQAHARCQMQAPYLPRIEGPQDLSNFSTGQQLPPPVVFFDEESTGGWDRDFEDRVGPCTGQV